MSIEGDRVIEAHLSRLCRQEDALAPVESPALSARISEFHWMRLRRLAQFWRKGDLFNETGALDESVLDFIGGLSATGMPAAFAIVGRGAELCVAYGVARAAGENVLPGWLRGAFGDVRIENAGHFLAAAAPLLGAGAALIGVPTWKRDEKKEKQRSDQIERLCRAMQGATWGYFVFAAPQNQITTAEQISFATRLAADVSARYLLSTNAADQNNRTAQRLTELLKKHLERLEEGARTGMWLSDTYVFAEDPKVVPRAQAAALAAFAGEKSLPVPLRAHPFAPGGTARAEPISSAELAALFSPPHEEYAGYELTRCVRYGVETQAMPEGTDSVYLGDIWDRGAPIGRALRIPRNDLTRHGLIVGVTGAGKTNTCFSLLEHVWAGGTGVPFLVIESAKSEYRALLKNNRFEGLRVFTVADETVSPLRLNPFEVPSGVLVQAHIDFLQALFSAAFVLYPPMPYVLSMSIQRVYEDKGWDLATNENRRGPATSLAFPTLDDLIHKVREVSDAMGYEGEIRANIKAGLEGRLNQLRIGGGKGVMLNCRESIPSAELFEKPCLLELKQLVNDEEKAFLIGLLLIRLHEHYEARGRIGDGKLRHVTLIEEAHRLLKNTHTTQGGDTANPQGKAIEVFANLLAEIRAYGEGIFMAEQIPTKLAPEALKNTNLKIVHRLLAKDDREAVGSTMGLDKDQLESLATLPPGEAVVYLEGLQKPALLRFPLSATKQNAEDVSSASLREAMHPYWQEHGETRCRYRACLGCATHGATCGRPPAYAEEEVISLQQLWFALRFWPELVEESWRTWSAVSQRLSRPGDSPYCRAIAWLHPFLERRAETQGWPLKATRLFIDTVVSAIKRLHDGTDARAALLRTRELVARIDQSAAVVRPYIGCEACPTPCLFRHEVDSVTDANQAELFTAEFDRQTPLAPQLGQRLAQRWLPASISPHASGIAFCLAATSLHRTRYAATERRRELLQYRQALLHRRAAPERSEGVS